MSIFCWQVCFSDFVQVNPCIISVVVAVVIIFVVIVIVFFMVVIVIVIVMTMTVSDDDNNIRHCSRGTSLYWRCLPFSQTRRTHWLCCGSWGTDVIAMTTMTIIKIDKNDDGDDQ